MTTTPCRYSVLQANRWVLFLAGLTVRLAACGTEGGNPHRGDEPRDPPPAKNEYETGGDNLGAPGDSQDNPSSPARPGSGKTQPTMPVCRLTVARGTKAGFDLVFKPAEPPVGGSVVEALLSRTVSAPPGGGAVVTKPVAEWSPEPGAWQLTVGLLQSGVKQNYCQTTFSLDPSQGTWAGVLLTVTGTD